MKSSSDKRNYLAAADYRSEVLRVEIGTQRATQQSL